MKKLVQTNLPKACAEKWPIQIDVTRHILQLNAAKRVQLFSNEIICFNIIQNLIFYTF